jgi:hypothetical protein
VKALTDQTEAQSLRMLHHAIEMGGTTRFGSKEVEQSYKELAGRIQSSEVIEGITDVAAQLAMALGSDLPEAVKVLENTLFATGVNVENATEGLKLAREYSAQLMKTAKLGGFSSLADVAEAVKFPTGIASVANVSLATEGALLALLHRGGQSGPESGVAMRQFVAALAKPTQPALTALDAAGIHYKNYVTAGKHMSAADLSEAFQRKLGKKLSPQGLQDIQAMLSNPEIAGDQAKFISTAMKRLGENLKPQDARQIAKVLGDFWQASISKVDINRLLRDLIGANLSVTQLDEIFGSKQGARFATASRAGLPFFDETRKQIENVPLDYPNKIATERMAGVAGAMGRLGTATENLGTRFVEANEWWLTPLLDETTKLINAFGQMDNSVLVAATAIGGLGAAAVTLRGLLFADRIITGGALAAGGAAAARGLGLTAAAGLLFNPYALGATTAGAVMRPMPLNEGEDERARQLKYGQGWLSNAPPGAGGFSPLAGGLGSYTELRGAATITNSLAISLDPGLIAKEIRSQLDAGGNLRADTGVSMPRSALPR